MAIEKRKTNVALAKEQLSLTQQRDDFFHLVRLLERSYAYGTSGDMRHQALGGDVMPAAEPVRFRAANQTGFAAHAVESVTPRADGDGTAAAAYDVGVNFMGLTGATGVLPQHYTRLTVERLRRHDYALADFLDLFNHRLISLFYRGWTKYRLPIQFETHRARNQQDPFTRTLQSLTGQYHRFHSEMRLYYGGHFTRHTRSAAALQSMLRDCLRHSVKVEPFQARWLPINHDDRLCIGSGMNGRNNRLGSGVLPGRRVWDIQSRCHIVIGPITHAEHLTMVPGTKGFEMLSHLIRTYTPAHIDVALVFRVDDNSRNRKRLGKKLQLGINTWLQTMRGNTRYGKVYLRQFARG
ncbi:MAG: type VI secretion system baseplate subunit TssG [Gammaproteobacteria bacterium]|nr:type VI secretion system baseplate subunit TssG [Gammaproteobacteria bacterium]